MIHLQRIGGRQLACWVSNGGFLPDRKTLVFIHGSGGITPIGSCSTPL